jgi:hypothetical protein
MPTERPCRSEHLAGVGNPHLGQKETNMEILTLVIQIVFPTTAVVLAIMTMRLIKDWQ